jgi:nitrogen regulatory protein PII-like uncharacterized protein
MTTSQTIQTILELAAGAFIIWSVFNENKLIVFEDKIKEKIKKLWRAMR